jgi:hypothetical protein
MKSARFVLACIALVAAPLIAVAAPGDPRLVNGVLEWPRTVTSESFVIVRGDDGVLYYVGLAATRRDGTITAGARVSVLGIEGRSAHEITAVGFGSGATTEAALAQLQGPRTPTASAAPAAAPTPAAPPVAAPAAAPVAAPTPAGPSPTPPGPAAVSPKPAIPVTAPTTQVAPSVAPTAVAPAPVVSPMPPAASAGGAAAIAAPAPAPMPPAVVPTAATSPAVAQPPIAATAPMVPVDDRRWTEVSGEIEAFVGRTVVLKVDGGRVTVDVSSLSGNLERMVAPGSKVKFYGVPVELRFKAMGFIDPDARGRIR